MLLAIYEKLSNTTMAKQIVKGYKKENPESKYNKTFNIILERIQCKKKRIFDYAFYDSLLHWKIDGKLKKEYEDGKDEGKNKESRKKQKTFVERVEVSPIVQPEVKEVKPYDEIMKFLKEKTAEAVAKAKSEDDYIKDIGIIQKNKIEALMKRIEETSGNNDYLNELYKKVVRIKAKENDRNR